MHYRLIHKSGFRRLILIYAGWGMDDNPFRGLSNKSYDIAVVWDYTSAKQGLPEEAAGYDEICLVAWSFGVYAAARLLDSNDRRITLRIAVNGTMFPVNDYYGIPEKMFMGTLAGMDERNMAKFRRRMCGSAAEYAEFMTRVPARSTDDAVAELHAYGEWCKTPAIFRWDVAVIGRGDAIFPVEAQKRAWMGNARIEETDDPHLPDFARIIGAYIIDKNLVGERFGSSRTTYTDNADVQRKMADRLFSLSLEHTYSLPMRILEIGCGTGLFSRHLFDNYPGAYIELWDIADCGLECSGEDTVFKRCDAETAIRELPDDSFDAIFSSAAIQWFNSPYTFIVEAARVVRPGGIVALSTFATDNMYELAETSGIHLHLPDMKEILASAGGILNIKIAETESETLKFESPVDVLRHIRATGVNGVNSNSAEGVTAARKVLQEYPVDKDGKCTLTYRPVYFVFKKKAVFPEE